MGGSLGVGEAGAGYLPGLNVAIEPSLRQADENALIKYSKKREHYKRFMPILPASDFFNIEGTKPRVAIRMNVIKLKQRRIPSKELSCR